MLYDLFMAIKGDFAWASQLPAFEYNIRFLLCLDLFDDFLGLEIQASIFLQFLQFLDCAQKTHSSKGPFLALFIDSKISSCF